jgi:hypothetical protein
LIRYLIAVALALGAVSVSAQQRPVSLVWTYEGTDAYVSVHLRPNGECAVIASLPREGSARLVNCTYSMQEPYVTLEWKHEIDGARPPSSRLLLVGNGEFIRVEGEPQRVLRRVSP